jgi:hypothetical protein
VPGRLGFDQALRFAKQVENGLAIVLSGRQSFRELTARADNRELGSSRFGARSNIAKVNAAGTRRSSTTPFNAAESLATYLRAYRQSQCCWDETVL